MVDLPGYGEGSWGTQLGGLLGSAFLSKFVFSSFPCHEERLQKCLVTLFRLCPPYFQTHSDYFEQVSSFKFQLNLETGAGDHRLILTAVVYLSKNRKHFIGAEEQACRNWTEGCMGSLWESHLLGQESLEAGNSLLPSLGFPSLSNDQ